LTCHGSSITNNNLLDTLIVATIIVITSCKEKKTFKDVKGLREKIRQQTLTESFVCGNSITYFTHS